MKIFFLAISFFIAFCAINLSSIQDSSAFNPEPILSDPVLESHAQEIFAQTRCLVCLGQAIDASDSQFAVSLRSEIRRKLENGASKQEILNNLVEEFGPDILLYPPKSTFFSILIAAILVSSMFLIFLFSRLSFFAKKRNIKTEF